MGKFIYSTPNRAPVPANPAERGFLSVAPSRRGFFITRNLSGQPHADVACRAAYRYFKYCFALEVCLGRLHPTPVTLAIRGHDFYTPRFNDTRKGCSFDAQGI